MRVPEDGEGERNDLKRHDFPSSEALAQALAGRVADALRTGIDGRDSATLAVSGGTTPGKFLEALSREKLDWSKVVVTLVDERFVPPSSERSNERLVWEKLLVNAARLARFVGLYSATATVEEAACAADAGIALLPKPFDAVVLGMGADGHTASYFPDAPNLAELTGSQTKRFVLPVHAPSGGEPRLTLTLPPIAGARFLALHIEGQSKKDVLDQALVGSSSALPIRAVIDAAPHCQVFWTP